MGIYSEWDKFCKMAKESAGTAGASLPPAARWRDNIPVYRDAILYFFSVVFVLFLYAYLFCLWLDIIALLRT